jgi:two-component system NtrC family sensor kinase
MTTRPQTRTILGNFLYRPVWLPVTITTALLFLALALLFASAWRGMTRLQPLEEHHTRMTQISTISLQLQKILLDHLDQQNEIPPETIGDIRSEIDKMLDMDSRHLGLVITAVLRRAQQVLDDSAIPPQRAITIALSELNNVLKSETIIHSTLVHEAQQTAELELAVASVTIVVLPALGLLILFLVRKRILVPLNNLGWLMSQLEQGDFATAPTQDVDPMLKPVVARYNTMVERLAELERNHNARQESLEMQVHLAASSLLEQQHSLAKAEKLAAVGELAARLAHELRNPLAGIQMALQNLQQEIGNGEHAERLKLVSNEIERITALLNGLLDQARQRPETLHLVHLNSLVSELLKLARYQLPEQIGITMDIPDTLEWSLPENGLRRSLLNLILNASQALGDTGNIGISARQDGDKLNIEVCDDGPGYPQTILDSSPRSFNSLRPGGTGLGLTAVQQFIKELHGNLTLHNIEPHGACARLTIPPEGHHV